MRNVRWSVAASGLAMFGALGWVMGCSASSQEDLTDPSFARSTGSGGASSTSTSTGSNLNCKGVAEDILTPGTITSFVNEDCGVFVQSDAVDASGDGTKARPFRSVQAAIAGAKGKAVFVCATSPFEEKLDIAAPLSLYGGFDCTKDWSWDSAARSVVTAKTDEIPVTIQKIAKDVTLWNVAIKAVDASRDSGSSIAMAIDDVAVTLTRCDVTAGAGIKGLAGMSQMGSAAAGANAASNVAAGCVSPYAALPGKTTCGAVKTDGGLGGLGGDTTKDSGKGQSGGDGAPAGAEGKGGVGDGQPGASVCSDGVTGKNGGSGSPGEAGTTKDTILSLAGVSGGSGGDGKAGGPGQGGGGGGGTRAGSFCGPALDMPGFGPGGGGGGSGGCGGVGGGGGQDGGSSIAILSLGNQLKLSEVVLSTSAGGNGGDGGLGGWCFSIPTPNIWGFSRAAGRNILRSAAQKTPDT